MCVTQWAAPLWWLREHIPLEQGLRLYKDGMSKLHWYTQRAYSIRTRIKTPARSASALLSGSQRAYSIRTRIKTKLPLVALMTLPLREHIPLEQGLRLFSVNYFALT